MFTDRNVFNLIYKNQLLSYYVFEQVISSKKTLSICAKKMFMKNSKLTWFSTKKSVYETEH